MKTKEIKLYTFKELSDKAKEKALSHFYDINVCEDWWEGTYENAANIGLRITGFDLDRNRHASGEFISSASEVAANIIRDHGEHCQTYKSAELFLEAYNPILADYMDDSSENYESSELEKQMIELEDDFLKSILEDYSIILQNESEYLTSEGAIIESIEANEYEFLEDGRPCY